MASAETPLTAVVKSVNDFTLDFYLTTAKNKGLNENILVSPLSAAFVTAMLHAGAKGDTANEISNGLKLPQNKTILEQGFKDLQETFANVENVTLEMANSIFLEKTGKLKEGFKQTISQVYNSHIQLADFKQQFEKERITINDWVSEKTHSKINNLLPEGFLDSSTALVLVNAVYFFGKWKNQFDPSKTSTEDFFVSKDNTVKVKMMKLKKQLHYADIPELDAQAVELCYTNEKVCLQIILPNAKDGLDGLHKKLQAGTCDLSTIQFYSTEVQLSLPKFKIEDTIDLGAIYKKMGMTKMFSDEADFSNMIEGENLKVSKGIQKTFIDVNEEGTEAAAASACVGRRKRCAEMPVEIYVDHPFVFRLLNGTSVLFVGALYEPTSLLSEDNSGNDNDVDPHFNDDPRVDDDSRPHKPSHCEL